MDAVNGCLLRLVERTEGLASSGGGEGPAATSERGGVRGSVRVPEERDGDTTTGEGEGKKEGKRAEEEEGPASQCQAEREHRIRVRFLSV